MKNLKLFIFLFLLLSIEPISAHHFKGLPHFNYFENYPQVPLDEFLGKKGEYEFSLVIYDFQGINKNDVSQPDNVRLYLAIYNLRENKTYQGSATLEVFCDDKSLYKEKFQHSEEESLYAIQSSFLETGDFSLRITMHDNKDIIGVVPFELSSQKKDWSTLIGVILFSLLLILAIGARKARIQIDRLSEKNSRTKD